MSYDLDYTYKKDGQTLTECFNITYNVSGMFYAVDSEGIRKLNLMESEESLQFLLKMYNGLVTRHLEMLQYEPINGWGSWENTVKCLNKMIMLVAENNLGYWEVE